MLFQEDRLGLFVHWGIYSVGGWHEQEQWRRGMSREEYGAYARRFRPAPGCTEEWLRLARDAGMTYLCFTAKHHDGFCMWDTALTDYNVARFTGRDVLRELAEGCRKYGILLELYYSIPDWHHPNSVNDGRSHRLEQPGPGDEPDELKYRAYLRGQIRELLTQYGPVAALFWDIPPGEEDPSINEYVRALQPGILINDRGYSKGDYSTPEREVPEGAFSGRTEACQSVGVQSWGYRAEEDYYSRLFLMDSVDRILARGGNYLLNVGPRPDGSIPEPAAASVRAVGDWYLRVRESFLGAEPLSVPGAPCGLTRRENDLYFHLPAVPQSGGLVLPFLREEPRRVTLLNTGERLPARVEYVPTLFDFDRPRERREGLHISGIPVDRLAGEVLVLKAEFGGPPELSKN